MRTETMVIRNPSGLHLRVAGKVAETVKRFEVNITICKDREEADGSSVMQMLMLGASYGCELEIAVNGKKEDHVIRQLREVFNDNDDA